MAERGRVGREAAERQEQSQGAPEEHSGQAHTLFTPRLKPHRALHQQCTQPFIPESSVRRRPYWAQSRHTWIKMETPRSLLCREQIKYFFENTWKTGEFFFLEIRGLYTSGVWHCILRASVLMGIVDNAVIYGIWLTVIWISDQTY